MLPRHVLQKSGKSNHRGRLTRWDKKWLLMLFSDRDYIRDTRQYIKAERELLMAAINEIPGLKTYKSVANFLLVFMDSRIDLNSTELKDNLSREGILIRDCSTFDGMGDRYFRVAVKKHKQNVILIEKLKEVVK